MFYAYLFTDDVPESEPFLGVDVKELNSFEDYAGVYEGTGDFADDAISDAINTAYYEVDGLDCMPDDAWVLVLGTDSPDGGAVVSVAEEHVIMLCTRTVRVHYRVGDGCTHTLEYED